MMRLITVGDWLSGRIELPLTFEKGEYITHDYMPSAYYSLVKDMNVDSQDVSGYQNFLSQSKSIFFMFFFVAGVKGVSLILFR